jgi:uncharacterized protein
METDQWESILKNPANTNPETICKLLDQGILSPDKVDETVVYNQWKNRHIHDFGCLRSKVLVTRGCNMRCTYCIIDKEPKVMSIETAQRMDEFYLDRIKNKKPQQVNDSYVGGEPLLNMKVILTSATRRYSFCNGIGIKYDFSITTNGTLVTSEFITQLKWAGLSGIRVSLAGPASIHDKLRPYKGGGGTYETILQNLERISGLTPIFIEYQYDAGKDDYRLMPEMLNDLTRRKIEVAQIAFTPILAKRGTHRYCTGMGDVEKYLFLIKTAAQEGFETSMSAPQNACMADYRSILVFDTDGALIPCPCLQAGERKYGNVFSGIDFVAEAQLLDRPLKERCLRECELLPICTGGCRLQALTLKGDFNGIDCHYPTYRRLLEDHILSNAQSADVNAIQAGLRTRNF